MAGHGMDRIDRHKRLEENPFTCRVTKDRRVFISWQGRQVMIIKGKEAEKFIARISQVNEYQAQLMIARITGHFKHGNEK
jgi:hypothetical protein